MERSFARANGYLFSGFWYSQNLCKKYGKMD